MIPNPAISLSMTKYERLIPRIFSGCIGADVRDRHGDVFWKIDLGESEASQPESSGPDPAADDNSIDISNPAWSKLDGKIERRRLPDGLVQFRAAISTEEQGRVGWLTITYDTSNSVPVLSAPEALRPAFADTIAMMQEEIELQSECNQLAAELTERYEELNLVYATPDQVEYFEEGQEALAQLVHNCADYLDVDFAALICRDRDLKLHSSIGKAPMNVEALLEILETKVYDRIESHAKSLVINQPDITQRRRLLNGRRENLLAQPILDDRGAAIGLLAVAVRRDKHTFSNGDRNLMEVMARKASRIIHMHHDSLTGLMNRGGFESSLISSIASARNKNARHCLLHVDLDQIHVINDLMGHQEGDQLIRRTAKLIRSTLRDSDVVSRLDGDEFGVLLSNCNTSEGQSIAEKIRRVISELTVVSANRQLGVSVSIGVAPIDGNTAGVASLVAAAEIACQSAKDAGRNQIQIFKEDNSTLIRRSEDVNWSGRVQEALRKDEFVLYCQPVAPVNSACPQHFERLVRMIGDDQEILVPESFLPAAERYQLMPLIDRWVVRNTLKALKSCSQGIAADGPVFCINLSGQSLTSGGFLSFVQHELEHCDVSPEHICFEITETAAISNIDEALSFMSELQHLGCRFALDDFGAGLSSFGYLKVLPVDYLKIDGSFIREVTTDQVSLSIVQSICQIGRTLELSLVAEFVGDEETKNILQRIGVDYLQGYYIGKPVPLEEITNGLLASSPAVSG